MTTPASVASDIDRSNSITVAVPTALSADVLPIFRLVLLKAGWTGLTRIRRVYLFDADTESFRFVRAELRELEERPRVLHAVVFAGLGTRGPTTCTCRALADTSERLKTNDAYALRSRMIHDLPGELVVAVAHPPALFALTQLDGAHLACLLQRAALAVELTALEALIAAIAKEPRTLPNDMDHAGSLIPKSTPMLAAPVVGSGAGKVRAISANHLPRFRVTRSKPGMPSSGPPAQRIAICWTVPSLTSGTSRVFPSIRQF
jgi:hypothetical protein